MIPQRTFQQSSAARQSPMSTDRGVSPVVGVILMISITVVLASVVGVFVLGLADLSAAPQMTLELSAGDVDDLVINHQGGSDMQLSEYSIIIDGETVEYTWDHDGSIGVGESYNTSGDFLDGESTSTVEIRHDPSGSIVASDDLTA